MDLHLKIRVLVIAACLLPLSIYAAEESLKNKHIFSGESRVDAIEKSRSTVSEKKITQARPAKAIHDLAANKSKLFKIFIANENLSDIAFFTKTPNTKKISYPSKTLFILTDKTFQSLSDDYKKKFTPKINLNTIQIGHRTFDTTRVPESIVSDSSQKQLFIIQFFGPVKQTWLDMLSNSGGTKIIQRVKNNALLVWANSEAISLLRLSRNQTGIQWIGDYLNSYKIKNELLTSERQLERATLSIVNTENTIETINKIRLTGAKFRQPPWSKGNFTFLRVIVDPRQFNNILALPDVYYIRQNGIEKLGGERQALTVMNSSRHVPAGTAPLDPTTPSLGYLQWITDTFGSATTGFDTFAVDIGESGLDQGMTNAANIPSDLLVGGTGVSSRIDYQRLINGLTIDTLAINNEDANSHGTLVASIIGGFNNTAIAADANQVENPAGFHYGLGIAPNARIGSTKIFNPAYTNPDLETWYSTAYGQTRPATIFNNSWGEASLADWGQYDAISNTLDSLVRDARPATASDGGAAGNQQAVIVFLTGNTGWNSTDGYIPADNPPTAVTPGQKSSLWNYGSTAKNTIVVGASEGSGISRNLPGTRCNDEDVSSSFSDDIRDTYYASSRGPTLDGRFKPDLVAPGLRISGAASSTVDTGTYPQCFHPDDEATPANEQTNYIRSRGTSFAAPAVAGAAALLKQAFINRKVAMADNFSNVTTEVSMVNASPSPALTKAWLMNTTRYLSRPGAEAVLPYIDPIPPLVDNLPSNIQGMGMLNVERALDSTPRLFRDQTHTFDGDLSDPATPLNRDYIISGKVNSSSVPFRVTLAWTDFPGATVAAFTPLSNLNNDLDLSVCVGSTATDCTGGTIYNGNNYSLDVSQAGGTVDAINNVESVWLPSLPADTDFFVTVTPSVVDDGAVSLNSSLNEQDFALVIYNATIAAQDDVLAITDDGAHPNINAMLTGNDVTAYTSTADALTITGIDTTGLDTRVSVNFSSGLVSYTVDESVASGTVFSTNFTYTVTDGHGATGTATVTLNVTGANDGPVAIVDAANASEDTLFISVIDLDANDTDADGDSLSVIAGGFATVQGGILTLAADGSYTYQPPIDFNGADSVNYTVTDGTLTDSATLMITVAASNDTPEITAPVGALFQLQNTTMDFAPGNTISVSDIDVDTVTGTFDVTVSVPGPGNGIFSATGATAGNGTNSISFSGNLNTVNAALATLSYTGNSGVTGTETVSISIDDNGNSGAAGEPNIANAMFDITLTANAPPELELDSDDDNRPAANDIDFENTFDLGTGDAIEIAEGTSIVDPDTTSPASVTITLTNLLDTGAETLTISGLTAGTTGNIDYNYTTDAVSGTLLLTPNGGASPTNAEYATAIDLVRYDNSATSPDTVNRIITVSVNDGISSDSATSTIDFQRRPVDIALVLDTSGSMQQLVDGSQRIDLLKDAVQLFLETWDGFDIPEDRLGTTYFNTNISTFPAVFAMESFTTNWPAHNTDVGTKTPGGWTSFGGGLQTAIEGLNAAPSGGLNRKPVVITFTDGQQNGSPMVMRPGTSYAPGDPAPVLDVAVPYQILDATVGQMVDDGFSVRTLSGLTQAITPINLSDTDLSMNIHTIGTGVSGSNLETMLAKLATDTNGASFFATPDSFVGVGAMPSPLQDHFMTTLVNSLSETSLEMVARVFSQLPANTARQSHRFALNNATQRASFVLSWNKNTNMDELAFGLKTPQGNFIPAGTSGIDIRSGDFYFIVHLNFPLISRFGSIPAGGEWEMVLQRKNLAAPPVTHSLAAVTPPLTQPVDYSVWVLEDESDVKDIIKSDKPRYQVGEPILITAKITDVARAAKKLLVSAQVKAPRIGLGSYLAKNYIRGNNNLISAADVPTATLDTPQTVYDKNLIQLLNTDTQPKNLVPLRKSIRLFDNGKDGDKVANDGIFSALYTETNIPGTYDFDIRVQGRLPSSGSISRQTSLTVVTQFDTFDVDNSIIEYSDIAPDSSVKDANKQLQITPIDKFGNLLGPGKSQLVSVNIKGGKLIGQLQDLGNGAYIQYLAVNQLLIDPVITIDAPGLTMIAVNTQSKLTLIEWVLLILVVVILLLVVFWLIKLIVKQLKK